MQEYKIYIGNRATPNVDDRFEFTLRRVSKEPKYNNFDIIIRRKFPHKRRFAKLFFADRVPVHENFDADIYRWGFDKLEKFIDYQARLCGYGAGIYDKFYPFLALVFGASYLGLDRYVVRRDEDDYYRGLEEKFRFQSNRYCIVEVIETNDGSLLYECVSKNGETSTPIPDDDYFFDSIDQAREAYQEINANYSPYFRVCLLPDSLGSLDDWEYDVCPLFNTRPALRDASVDFKSNR